MLETQSDDAAQPAMPGTIEAVFAARESSLLLYARRLVKSDDIAQDIVQEAFMKLHVQFDSVQQPAAWLYRTVHNLALNQLRSAQKIVPLIAGDGEAERERAELIDPQPLPDEQIERMEAIGQTRLCLATLAERQRELLRLKFEEDLSYQQISERTQLSISNVGYLLHHALKDLAAALKKAGVMP